MRINNRSKIINESHASPLKTSIGNSRSQFFFVFFLLLFLCSFLLRYFAILWLVISRFWLCFTFAIGQSRNKLKKNVTFFFKLMFASERAQKKTPKELPKYHVVKAHTRTEHTFSVRSFDISSWLCSFIAFRLFCVIFYHYKIKSNRAFHMIYHTFCLCYGFNVIFQRLRCICLCVCVCERATEIPKDWARVR